MAFPPFLHHLYGFPPSLSLCLPPLFSTSFMAIPPYLYPFCFQLCFCRFFLLLYLLGLPGQAWRAIFVCSPLLSKRTKFKTNQHEGTERDSNLTPTVLHSEPHFRLASLFFFFSFYLNYRHFHSVLLRLQHDKVLRLYKT